jgi:hypothetical protein
VGFVVALYTAVTKAASHAMREMPGHERTNETPAEASLAFDDSDGLKRQIADVNERLENLAVAFATKAANTDGFEEEARANIKQLGKSHNESRDFTRIQLVSIYNALNATHQRERMAMLSKVINVEAEELQERVAHNAHLDEHQWKSWEAKLRAWRTKLEEWCAIANCYLRGTSDMVLTVSEEEMLAASPAANVGQFHAHGAFEIYKGFTIRFAKWQVWHEQAENEALRVALNGTAGSRPL